MKILQAFIRFVGANVYYISFLILFFLQSQMSAVTKGSDTVISIEPFALFPSADSVHFAPISFVSRLRSISLSIGYPRSHWANCDTMIPAATLEQ